MLTLQDQFEDVMLAHRDEIYRYVWRMVGNTPDAQDLTQEAFLKAFRAFDRLAPDSNVRAWLYKIATNACLNFLKKRSRENAATIDIEWILETVADPDSPSEVFSREELLREVATAVEALPPSQRAAIIQRKYQDLSYTEIAACLDCSEDSARAHVYQGMQKLRVQFRNQGEVA